MLFFIVIYLIISARVVFLQAKYTALALRKKENFDKKEPRDWHAVPFHTLRADSCNRIKVITMFYIEVYLFISVWYNTVSFQKFCSDLHFCV